MTRSRLRTGIILGAAMIWLVFIIARYYLQFRHPFSPANWSWAKFTGDPSLPFFREALERAVRGLTGAGASLVAAITVGAAIARIARWRFASRIEAIPVTASLGIGALAYLGLSLATVGYYRAPVLQSIIAACAMTGLVWLAAILRRQHAAATLLPQPRRRGRFWLICTVSAGTCALIAALAPEIEFDALWYHLTYPRDFLSAGTLVDRPDDYVSLYPMTFELWFGYGLATGGAAAAKLLHFACLPLTALMLFQLASRFGRGTLPHLTVAIFVGIPLVMWEASTAYIDLGLALQLTIVIYALLHLAWPGNQRISPAGWLAIAAINMGFALASKHLALMALAVLCPGIFFLLWRVRKSAVAACRPVLVFAVIAIAIAMPWYIRSFIATGNPVFPELHRIFGAPSQRWNDTTQRELTLFLRKFGGGERSVRQLLLLPWHTTMHAAVYGATFGPLFLMIGPFLLLRRWRGATPWLLLFVVMYLALWASPLASLQLRFLVPISPIIALLAALAIRRLMAVSRAVAGRRTMAAIATVVLAVLLLNLPFFTPFHERDGHGRFGWLTHTLRGLPVSVVIGAVSQDEYLRTSVSSYATSQYIDRNTPSDARILSWINDGIFYLDKRHLWANSAAYIDFAWAPAGNEASVLAKLRELGITHLLVQREQAGFSSTWDMYAITGPTARNQWYESIYQNSNYTVFRIRWETLPKSTPSSATTP